MGVSIKNKHGQLMMSLEVYPSNCLLAQNSLTILWDFSIAGNGFDSQQTGQFGQIILISM